MLGRYTFGRSYWAQGPVAGIPAVVELSHLSLSTRLNPPVFPRKKTGPDAPPVRRRSLRVGAVVALPSLASQFSVTPVRLRGAAAVAVTFMRLRFDAMRPPGVAAAALIRIGRLSCTGKQVLPVPHGRARLTVPRFTFPSPTTFDEDEEAALALALLDLESEDPEELEAAAALSLLL